MNDQSGSAIPIGQGSGRALSILLVEDNPADVRLVREALRDCRDPVHLAVAGDGVEAMAYLRREAPHAEVKRPDLVLLDLNLPRKDGREVLAEMKADPALGAIPVIVFTSSNAAVDVRRAYELHASCYVRKPIGLDEFLHAIRSIQDFWLRIVQLPA